MDRRICTIADPRKDEPRWPRRRTSSTNGGHGSALRRPCDARRGSARQPEGGVRSRPPGLRRPGRPPRPDGPATRVATDKQIQDNLKKTVDELREASRRVQGKEDHGARNTMLLLAGITAGILLNPMTGPADAQVDQGKDPRRELRLRLRRRARRAARRGPSTNSQQVRALARASPRRINAPSPPAETGAASARSSEPGSSPLALEMSAEQSRKAPGRGARAAGTGGTQPRPATKLTSSRRRHADRYGYGLITPS